MKNRIQIKGSLLLFGLIALSNTLAELFEIALLHLITKPILIPSLSLYLYFSLKKFGHLSLSPKQLYAALACSFLGDVLLMGASIDTKIPFFLLGLGAFFLAHLFYLIFFLSLKKSLNPSSPINYFIAIPLSFYLISLLFTLWEGLDTGLKIPVIAYGLIISTMAYTAYQLKSVLKKTAFIYFYTGILLFILSDSIIGINRFSYSIPNSGFWIMSTYSTAQFLIVYPLMQRLISQEERTYSA